MLTIEFQCNYLRRGNSLCDILNADQSTITF